MAPGGVSVGSSNLRALASIPTEDEQQREIGIYKIDKVDGSVIMGFSAVPCQYLRPLLDK